MVLDSSLSIVDMLSLMLPVFCFSRRWSYALYTLHSCILHLCSNDRNDLRNVKENKNRNKLLFNSICTKIYNYDKLLQAMTKAEILYRLLNGKKSKFSIPRRSTQLFERKLININFFHQFYVFC